MNKDIKLNIGDLIIEKWRSTWRGHIMEVNKKDNKVLIYWLKKPSDAAVISSYINIEAIDIYYNYYPIRMKMKKKTNEND